MNKLEKLWFFIEYWLKANDIKAIMLFVLSQIILVLCLFYISGCTVGGKYKTSTGLNHKEQKKWVKEIRQDTKNKEFSNYYQFYGNTKK